MSSRPLPLTSVIMVSFYTGPELFSAIASVLSQRVPVELIVVDNGNPEQAVEALKRKSSADPRMKLVTGHGNVGFGKGNNMGVAESRGDYVLILNPDSRLNDESLAKLHSHADALPHPFMIGARILNEDGSDQRGCRRELLTPCSAFVEALHLHCLFPRLRLNLHEEPVPASITPMPAISGAFMFLSREDYDLIGGFDDGYFLHVEDLDFCFRFHKAGGEIYFAPDVPVTHTGSTSLSTTDFLERHKAKGFTRYFHRNFRGKYPLILLWSLDIAIWGRYILRRSTNFIASRIK